MLEKSLLLVAALVLVAVSGLLFTNHPGLAIKATNYAYLLIALFFLFRLLKPKHE